MFWPCETRTSTCRNFATISSGLYRFFAITVLLDVKDIPQVGPLQWGRITRACLDRVIILPRYQFSTSGHFAPGCHDFCQEGHQRVERTTHDHEDRDRTHHQRGIEACRRDHDDQSKPLLGGNELADDRANHCQRNGDFHPAQDVWKGIREPDLPEYLTLGC